MNLQQRLLYAKLAVLFLLGGCYAPSPPDKAEPELITINIENKTFERGIGVLATEKVRDEFMFDGRLNIAENKNDANLLLSGQIISYIEDKRAGEYYVIIEGRFTLEDLQVNEVLWKDKAIKGSSVAPTGAEAKKRALAELARDIINYVVASEFK